MRGDEGREKKGIKRVGKREKNYTSIDLLDLVIGSVHEVIKSHVTFYIPIKKEKKEESGTLNAFKFFFYGLLLYLSSNNLG